MTPTRLTSPLLAFTTGIVLCATLVCSWLMTQPFVGGGPGMVAMLGTLSLLACTLGVAVAAMMRPIRHRASVLGGLWLVISLFLWLARTSHARLLELLEPYGLLLAVGGGFAAVFAVPIALLLCVLVLLTLAPATQRRPSLAGLALALLAAAASFAALLWVGFPTLGVTRCLSLATSVAIGCTVWCLLSVVTQRLWRVALVSLLPFLVAAALLPSHPGPHAQGLRSLAHTGTQELRVLDQGDFRYLLVDGEPRIAIDPSTGDASAPDPSTLELMLQFFWPSGKALFIGMPEPGLARALKERDWQVDVVEHEALLRQAQEHLHLSPDDFERIPPSSITRALLQHREVIQSEKSNATVGIDELTAPYQIIVVQTRGAARRAQPLATLRGVAMLRSLLDDDAILVFRIEAPGWQHAWPQAVGNSLMHYFDEVWALPVTGGPRNAGSLVLAASDRYLEIRNHHLPTPQDHPHHPEAQLQSGRARNAWRYRFVPDTDAATQLRLTHNMAPYWLEDYHIQDRRRLHHRLGGRTRTW